VGGFEPDLLAEIKSLKIPFTRRLLEKFGDDFTTNNAWFFSKIPAAFRSSSAFIYITLSKSQLKPA